MIFATCLIFFPLFVGRTLLRSHVLLTSFFDIIRPSGVRSTFARLDQRASVGPRVRPRHVYSLLTNELCELDVELFSQIILDTSMDDRCTQ